MRKTLILLFLSLSVLVSCGGSGGDNPPPKKSEIVISSTVLNPSFIGNGAQWGGYDVVNAWTGNPTLSQQDWNTLFERVRFMRPPIVRIMVEAGWNYNTDGKFNPEKSEPMLIKILDFCQKEGITVMFGEWGHWGGTSVDEQWLDMSVRFFDWLVNTKGFTCIKYFNMVNEPNGDWSSIKGNYGLWKNLIGMFYAKLEEKGLQNMVKIIGPDIAIWDTNLTSWMSNTNFDLGSKVGIYDIHTYPPEDQVRNGQYQTMVRAYKNASPNEKDILMGELGFKYPSGSTLGKENIKRIAADKYASDDSNMMIYDAFYGIDMADAMIQNMLAGYSGSIVWDMDDAMYNIGSYTTKLKRWGFWNILGSEKFENPADENIRPWFYTVSLLCRYFPQGTKLYNITLPDKKGLRAVVGEKNGKYTIAIINSHLLEYDIDLKMENGTKITGLKKYNYQSGSGSSFIGKVDSNGLASPEATSVNLDLSGNKAETLKVGKQTFILYTNID